MIRSCCLTAALLFSIARPAVAWWDTGHSYITQNSPQHLPEPLQTFTQRFFPFVNFYSYTEPPGLHFIDIDVYSEFLTGQMPRDINVLYNKYGVAYVNSQGTSPWTIANYRATLTAQMASAREIEDLYVVAQTAGEMAHYLEDINQPLHTTRNYNGQFSNNNGIHARYEGTMIERHFSDLPITQATPVYISDTVDWVLDSIEDRTYDHVADVLAADTLAKTFGNTSSNAYYNSLWNSTGAFTKDQFQYATEMVASLWYSAWVDAGSPALSISGDYNNDGTVDAADEVVWRNNLGTGASLANDHTPGVDAADHGEWRAHFGQSITGEFFGTFSMSVPEPNTTWLLASFFAWAGACSKSRGR